MTPGARLQTAIEILDQVIAAAQSGGAAADTIIGKGFAARRYAGSKDRAAIRDLIYRAIRRFGEPPVSARAAFATLADKDAGLGQDFDGSPYGPAVLSAEEPRAEGGTMPEWLARQIAAADQPALLERAPLDLRANRLKTTREALQAQWPDGQVVEGLDDALRFDPPFAVEQHDAWRDGLVEVQDAGSQFVVAACGSIRGKTVIDLCAGGGGKTLALASAMRGEGRLIACDTDRSRLARLVPRASRAGADVEVRLLDGGREVAMLEDLVGIADVVLVDAPCSGSGTLRRSPEARWRLHPSRIDALVATQAHVMSLAAPLVRPAGVLIYAVCSLIAREGAGQLDRFLARHAGWTAEPPFAVGRSAGHGRILTPAHDRTDGFFVARLTSPC